VAPLYAVQSGLSYTFAPGGWVALNTAISKAAARQSMMLKALLNYKGFGSARRSWCR
jgi:hypothetical protein